MHELPLFWLAALVSRAGLVLLFVALILALRRRRPQRPAVPAPLPHARTTSTAGPILASDAERDATAGQLSEAIAEGRLGIDEGRQRIDAALRARHRHELATLTADLPPPSRAAGPPPMRSSRWPVAAIGGGALVLWAFVLAGAASSGANVAVLLVAALAILAIARSRRRRAER
ncbi:MAG: DUF1707 domain-containing protein [Actinomycetota bacterium]|nr:DUF1707 domain-containing protein [Actinomycetota bacterium]